MVSASPVYFPVTQLWIRLLHLSLCCLFFFHFLLPSAPNQGRGLAENILSSFCTCNFQIRQQAFLEKLPPFLLLSRIFTDVLIFSVFFPCPGFWAILKQQLLLVDESYSRLWEVISAIALQVALASTCTGEPGRWHWGCWWGFLSCQRGCPFPSPLYKPVTHFFGVFFPYFLLPILSLVAKMAKSSSQTACVARMWPCSGVPPLQRRMQPIQELLRHCLSSSCACRETAASGAWFLLHCISL